MPKNSAAVAGDVTTVGQGQLLGAPAPFELSHPIKNFWEHPEEPNVD